MPADKLLKHAPTDGFKPICDFLLLENQCPDNAFRYPHLNKRKGDLYNTDSIERVTVVWYSYWFLILSLAMFVAIELIRFLVHIIKLVVFAEQDDLVSQLKKNDEPPQ